MWLLVGGRGMRRGRGGTRGGGRGMIWMRKLNVCSCMDITKIMEVTQYSGCSLHVNLEIRRHHLSETLPLTLHTLTQQLIERDCSLIFK